ncbi:MAG: response regulator transcription factor [Sedimentisphaerales bacterium]|nr:response regulator transcription factor [Sedimentisphaerales bacterium]
MSIRIVIADDHGIVREGLRSLLGKQQDMEIVGEAADGRKALELVRELMPDVVVMDITMPNLNGVDSTRQIVGEFPNLKVIALSMHSCTMFVADMIKAGASGYLLKDCLFDELVEAIRIVCDGGTYLSPGVISVVVNDYVNRLTTTSHRPLESLTDREREVLQLIGEGKNTKQIAMRLHVSTKAIEANRRKIMEKLHTQSIADLVRWAILGGLTSLEVGPVER